MIARISCITTDTFTPGMMSKVIMMTSSGNIFRVTGYLYWEFTGHRWIPTQRPVTRSLDVFFDLRLDKRLSKQWWSWWFNTPSRPSRRHSNDLTNISIHRIHQASVYGMRVCKLPVLRKTHSASVIDLVRSGTLNGISYGPYSVHMRKLQSFLHKWLYRKDARPFSSQARLKSSQIQVCIEYRIYNLEPC